MARIALTSGAYEEDSLVANAQKCVNLYPEATPAESQPPVPVTHYSRPGLLLKAAPDYGPGRGLYRASNGDLYAVIGQIVYYIAPSFAATAIGQIAQGSSIVSMADNGTVAVLVDGTINGYTIDLQSHAFTPISDPAFYGADRVQYLDGFFIFNRPNTPQFYISGYNAVTFDGLDIAAKVSYPDNLQAIVAVHGSLWLLGTLQTEVWYNSGNADFTFARQPGGLIDHGCAAKYSVAVQDRSVFWLTQDLQGRPMVFEGNGLDGHRISTHAIEAEIQDYRVYSDAVGYCFQQEGHAFYVLTFPSADKTWVYDLATKQWHQRAWADDNGVLHRERPILHAFAYGQNLGLDWQNGRLYAFDPDTPTDNGQPIVCIRAFPHLLADGRQAQYTSFMADISTGFMPGTMTEQRVGRPFDNGFDSGFGPQITVDPPMMSLRWSDTRGATWGDAVLLQMGAAGQYDVFPTVRGLGMARDRVFELSWSEPTRAALNGAWIDAIKSGN